MNVKSQKHPQSLQKWFSQVISDTGPEKKWQTLELHLLRIWPQKYHLFDIYVVHIFPPPIPSLYCPSIFQTRNLGVPFGFSSIPHPSFSGHLLLTSYPTDLCLSPKATTATSGPCLVIAHNNWPMLCLLNTREPQRVNGTYASHENDC